jgi:hypothetical protein
MRRQQVERPIGESDAAVVSQKGNSIVKKIERGLEQRFTRRHGLLV